MAQIVDADVDVGDVPPGAASKVASVTTSVAASGASARRTGVRAHGRIRTLEVAERDPIPAFAPTVSGTLA